MRMTLSRATIPGVLCMLALGGAPPALALNPLGFYAGAGVGESTVRSDDDFGPGNPGDFRDHHTAFKAILGVRPLSVLGAEFEYIDFGHASNYAPYTFGSYTYGNTGVSTHPRAAALFAVGYLPLPVPSLDVYGKLGAARLDTSFNGTLAGTACAQNLPCTVPYQQSRWSTNLAYGVGAQTKLLGVTFRAEYERISSTMGDPDVFSISAIWTF